MTTSQRFHSWLGCNLGVLCLFVVALGPGTAWSALTPGSSALEPMSEQEMASVSGQALFVGDKILPTGDGDGSENTDFTFHRMGLDVNLALNANIDKLQLGCGGFNNTIALGACDIDMDFVRFMGRAPGTTTPGAPATSDFVLTRPYVSIAVVNDGSPTQREVAGIKIGAEQADGFMSVGRDYLNPDGSPSGRTNLENGGTCNNTEGDGALACHSGINRISGNIRAELSGELTVSITLAGSSSACFGRTDLGDGQCSNNARLYQDINGSRINEIVVPNLKMNLSGGLGGAISDSAYAQVVANTRMIHGFALENTQDFFLSFQRQRIAYPNFDASGYAVTANAGWWMNVPLVKILDLEAPDQSLGLFEGLDALSPPGIPFENVEFGQTAASNCHGGQMFC